MKGCAFVVLLLSVTSAAAQQEESSTTAFSAPPSSAFVAASDLAVPSRARKEFEKANELIRRQELQQAAQKLKKAVSIYPQYAVAYNNLAVIYSHLGDQAREDEALQKAISLNPSFALAYLNVGRMNLRAGRYPAAESALHKAASLSPADPITLILLCYSQFMEKSFDAAITSSRMAHSLDSPHAFAHRVAARAFEQEKQGANAIAELETFLKEEPSGPRADAARHEIDVVRAALPN
jgi:tetratricopeptide (TPR) repeat protein